MPVGFSRYWTAFPAGLFILTAAMGATAQTLSIQPVTIQLPPGQMATTLTVGNQGTSPTSFQIRAFAWTEQKGEDALSPTRVITVSPPLGTIPPGGKQVVRLVLHQKPAGKEETYRIWLDEIPAAAASPESVRIALRVSIPVFAQPAGRGAPDVTWRIERDGSEDYLVAANAGARHETVRNLALTGPDGRAFKTDGNASPHILAGGSRRWHIDAPAPGVGGTAHLSANTDAGTVVQVIKVASGRP